LSAQGSLKKTLDKVELVIADGTGFSYNDVYPLKFFRGKDIREVKSHVRVVAMIGIVGDKRRVVLSANAGGAYSSELKLALPMVDALKSFCSDGYFIADKCYDSVELMRRLVASGLEPAIKVKESRHFEIRSELRLRSKANSERGDIYGKRYLIESLFGTVKQKLSSHIKVKRDDIAMKFALIRILIFNLYALLHGSPQIFFVLVCGFISSLPKSPTRCPFRANLPSAPPHPPTVYRRNKLFRTASNIVLTYFLQSV